MSSSEAQKSPVHHATEDSTAEPTNQTRQPAGLAPNTGGNPGANAFQGADRDRLAEEAARLKAHPDTAMGVPGNFERGAALADVRPDTDVRTNGAFTGGDVDPDRKKLFPDQGGPGGRPGASSDETAIGKDRDESSYGGPLKIEDPTSR